MDKQEFLKIISHKIRFIRASKGYSQDKLALESNIDRTHISRIERGKANPTAFQLIKIALVLNIEVGEFFPTINDIQEILTLNNINSNEITVSNIFYNEFLSIKPK